MLKQRFLISGRAIKQTAKYTAVLSSLFIGLTACSTNDVADTSGLSSEELITKSEELSAREAALAKREAELRQYQAGTSAAAPVPLAAGDNELLPPNARPGECYARAWVEPTYQERTEQILVSEESARVEVIPASYQMVSETVLKKPEGTKLVTRPATYDTVTEQKLIREGGLFWKTELSNGKPVNADLLAIASKGGIDLDSATPGMCFHEHYTPAQYSSEMQQVLIKEESQSVELTEPEYRWVDKEVLVSEASTRLETIPARYETVTEQVLDKPAHTVWKKGSGPIQKIDDATGEIMCLIEVPATYKTISKQVLVSDATTRSVEIPAKYEMVKVRELVQDAQEIRRTIPAEYRSVSVTKQVSEPGFVWHEISDNTMSSESRTGKKICLTEQKPVYETVSRRVVLSQPTVEKIVIPAEYETIQVRKLVKDAEEIKTVIPASYKTVSIKEVEKDGFMEWRTILCETNMTTGRIRDIQQSLADQGYNPGAIDGVIGGDTMQAVNAYQRDKGLPVDKYLNIETLESLNISI